jgi:hypothetical protein
MEVVASIANCCFFNTSNFIQTLSRIPRTRMILACTWREGTAPLVLRSNFLRRQLPFVHGLNSVCFRKIQPSSRSGYETVVK